MFCYLISNLGQLIVHPQAPSAVSEEEVGETRRKIFLAPGEKRPQRPELQGGLIIQSKAAEQ